MQNTVEDKATPDGRLRGTRRSRIAIVVACFIVAPLAGLGASWLVAPRFTAVASVCAIWVALYPIARINRREAWWAHWLRGVVMVLGFWIATRVFNW